MFIDTHAHLGDSKYTDISKTITEFTEGGVSKVISIGCTYSEIESVKRIISTHENIFASFGVYPLNNREENLKQSDEELMDHLQRSLDFPRVVAIGECGIDLTEPPQWEEQRSVETQIALFEKQIEMGIARKLPVIVHSRNSNTQVLNTLGKYKGQVDFVWHCFTENKDVARKVLDIGGNISFTGIITYKNTTEIQEAVQYIPADRFMIETDAPFLTPEPTRSTGVKINSPLYVKIIANKIAEIRGISVEEVESQTSENAINFFKLPL